MPNIPLHLQARLAKSTTAQGTSQDATNASIDPQLAIPTTYNGADYCAPVGRPNGHVVFRRWLDGTLDVEGVASSVIEILAKVRCRGPITDFERIVLSVAFPGVFQFENYAVAQKMLLVNAQLTVSEMQEVAMCVASRLAEEENYNSGYGGGTVQGRRVSVG